MAQVNVRCPLCNQPSQVAFEFASRSPHALEGQCDRCGYVRIMEDAVAEANRLGKLQILSAWFRRIDSREVSLVKRLDIATIIADTPEYSVLEKLDLTLDAIAAKTPEPGQRSQFTPQNDYPLVYAGSVDEAAFYIRQLESLGYVEQTVGMARIVASGFQHLMEMQKSGRTSAFAFVAMSFAENMNDVYDNAIEHAIRDAGYKPIRVDRTEHVKRIDDEVLATLRTVEITADGVDLKKEGLLGPSSTWTYMINDNPTGDILQRLLRGLKRLVKLES